MIFGGHDKASKYMLLFERFFWGGRGGRGGGGGVGPVFLFLPARLARKYFAVQASSAASEPFFSQAGLVVASNRNRM